MKKKILVLLSIIAVFSCQAQKAYDFISVNDIFRVITYRYITSKNETKDAKALESFYTPIFKSYGYTHELPGDGYGGPCSIIDGFYKGGYDDKENFRFVPTDKKTASFVFLSACNDGEDGDYGYLEVIMTVYSKSLAECIFADIESSGFELFDFDNPEEAGDVKLYYNGDKQVICDNNEEENSYIFSFGIAK